MSFGALITVIHCISITTLPTVYASSKSKGKIPSKDLILHPDYYNSTTQLVESDIGIIYLSESIFFDHEYRPICLNSSPATDMSSSDKEQLIIIAHGGSKIQKEARFSIIDNKQCEDILKIQDDDHDQETESRPSMKNKLCAASMNDTNTGTCKGDSGSPLLFETQDLVLGNLVSKFTLIGLVSSGSDDCKSKPTPTVFTEIYSYQSWIMETIESIEKSYSGRYCVGDLTEQCGSCDVSYKLEGVNCAQEFTGLRTS